MFLLVIGGLTRHVGASIVRISKSIAVIVGIGTTVRIFKPVCVFRDLRALVGSTQYAIAIRVRVGAAIPFLIVTRHTRYIWAGIKQIGDRISIVIRLWTAIFIFEAVDGTEGGDGGAPSVPESLERPFFLGGITIPLPERPGAILLSFVLLVEVLGWRLARTHGE